MSLLKLIPVCVLFLMAALLPAQVARILPKADEIQIEAEELTHLQTSGDVKAKGKVVVTYGDLQMTADEASLNANTGEFSASGDVKVTLKDQGSWQAPAIQGNIQKKEFRFGPFRMDSEVWHAGGQSGSYAEDGDNVLSGGWLSTCELHHPHYRLSAKEIIHHPDQTFTARHVTLRFGSVPVFYLPWVWGSTNTSSIGWIIKPGYSGKRGAYLQIGRVWQNETLGENKLYLDLMSKRGLGLGFDSDYTSAVRDLKIQLYGLLDRDTPETIPGYNRRFAAEDDRFRLNTYYRHELLPDLTLRLNVDYLSDIAMLEDWFRRDYRRFEQPKSFADLTYDHKYFSAGLNIRPRINEFNTAVESLPELRLIIPKIALGHSPLHYNSENSLGYYRMKWRNFDLSRQFFIPPAEYLADLHTDPADYSSFRADTLHTFSLPLDLGSALTIAPRASFRATSYSRSSRSKLSTQDLADIIAAENHDHPHNQFPVKAYDDQGGSLTRLAAEFGLEMRSKFWSDWQESQLPSLQIGTWRHIVEPYLNYTFAPEPSEDRDNLYFFDSIDRLQRQHFLRLGLDQRWQTRQGDRFRDLLRWQSYLDVHFDRGDESGRYPGDWGNRWEFDPRGDFGLRAVLLHDLGEGDIQRGEFGLRLGAEEALNGSLKYIYRNDHLSRSTYSMGSSLVDFTGESGYVKKYFETTDTISATVHFPINAKTQLDINAEYDLEKHRLSEHTYELSRQLHCWTMVLGVGWDNHDFQVMLMFRLTAFPKVKVDLDF